jgi:hypothetical protein
VTVFTIRSPASSIPARASDSGREHHCGDAPFHVAGAAPQTSPSRTTASNGSTVHADTGSTSTTSTWPLQQQRAPAAGSGEAGDELRPAGKREAGRHHRVTVERRGVRLCHLDLGARGLEASCEMCLQRGFVSRVVAFNVCPRVESD